MSCSVHLGHSLAKYNSRNLIKINNIKSLYVICVKRKTADRSSSDFFKSLIFIGNMGLDDACLFKGVRVVVGLLGFKGHVHRCFYLILNSSEDFARLTVH